MKSVQKSLAILSITTIGFFGGTAAQAHTETNSTSPANGSTVAAGDLDIKVSFSDKILNLAESSEIVITGDEDAVAGVGCVTVVKKSMSAPAFVGTPGNYKVTWRTVAEDGHPINGKFTFTVTGSAEGSALKCENGQTVAVSNTDDSGVVAPLPETSGKTDQSEADSASTLYNYLIGAAVLAVAVVLLLLLRKRKSTK